MNNTIYKEVNEIKANVKIDWSHGNHKFQPGDAVEVNGNVIPREWVGTDGTIKKGRSYVSQRRQRRVGRVGQVVAVTCLPNGKVRSNYRTTWTTPSRMYTRYYIKFTDGIIMGYESHHLNKATSFAPGSDCRV